MENPYVYAGIDDDEFGGMTAIGKTIRDAWVFEILDETENGKGWNMGQINDLRDKVYNEWDKYGCLVSNLPADLFERHQKIHNQAIEKAREQGWSGEVETDNEN